MNGVKDGNCLTFELDVSTRWNSTLYMLKKVLDLKDFVLNTTKECTHPPELLQHSDYQIMEDVIPMMQLIENATKEASKSKCPTASVVIPLMINIKIMIEKCPTQTSIGVEFKKKPLSAVEKREKTYENNDILGIATILDPRFKKQYFRNPLRVATFVEKIIKMTKTNVDAKSPDNLTNDTQKKTAISIWDIHDELIRKRNPSEHILPEVKQYLNQQLWDRDTDPIRVWNDQLRSSFPGLFPLAMQYFSVPCSSVSAEGANSRAGDIKSETRNRITGEHLNELLFLGSLTKEQWGLK